ncbi:hypothetical protein N7448_003376 [Penicillium atrosanguineum]|uniref:transferase caf17 n=1 Tax=Penicillium atrosanguineum TaxID=1132637 RepID=UPI00239D2E0F|nr:transferase caf17 [Penicillium atrosanguineum]KAJ5139968.1 hypothetical protein N7448_003376 [Penicillium atrosanguineum]KAJ5309884.1 transferase caf17 [Penicillium atrosanguineum]
MSSAKRKVAVNQPSRPQLAFALAIVKQKPVTEGVKEYLLKFRHFLKRKKESEVVADGKFFDSVSFWQKAYEESQAEQTKLLNIIYELEQRNESLLAKVKKEFPESERKNGTSTKRKAGSTSNITESSELRKKRSRRPMKDKAEDTGNEVESPSLMRPMYALQRALQRRRGASSLAIDAVILCKAAEYELLSAIQREIQATKQMGQTQIQKEKGLNLLAVTRGVEVSFHLVHRSLKSIAGAKNGSHGQVTYYLVCLFESTMTALTQRCTAMREQTTHGQDQVAPLKAEAYGNLTNLLSEMILSLDLSRQEDQEVMEGFLFITLDRVGKMLALCVFRNLHLATNFCPKLRLPDGLTAMNREDVTPQDIQLEAKYLMIFLDNVLGSESSLNSPESPMQSRFVRQMKNRLQKTLLQTVFGTEDPLFQDGLVRPTTPPPQSRDAHHVEEAEFPEWFTQELWRLVGWDLLNSTVRSR